MRTQISVAIPLILCSVLASTTGAQTWSVPGDFPDLQAAIDGVPDNAVIQVGTGTAGAWESILIDKPLTLIGMTQPFGGQVLITPGGSDPQMATPAITLAGPGHGVVRLVNLQLGGGVWAGFFQASDASIAGGGFEALHIYDSVIDGAPWQDVYNTVIPGADAVRVDLPLLWIERCTVRGGDTGFDPQDNFTSSHDAGTAIINTGTVVLLDSTVRGGRGPGGEGFGGISWDDGGNGGCPPACPGGAGGDGVICDRLVRAASSIAAGAGTVWKDDNGVNTCCQGPSGTALIAAVGVTDLANDLVSSGPARLGQPYSLAWTTPGPLVLLFVASSVAPAPQLGAPGLYLQPPLFLGTALVSPGGLQATIPNTPAFAGLELALQCYSLQGWSRPVATVIAP
ncbi:MAG: hypothetical protein ACT4PU_09215 [Planctomycetota bacterium]